MSALTLAHACGDELKLTGRVVDAANILSAETRSRLNAVLAAYQQRTHHQMVVVTTPTLGGSDIAMYGVRLFRRWGIGRRGVNDGVGLLIAPVDRRARIEVGYGLERALPDDAAARIMATIAVPRFKAKDFGGGAEATVGAIISTIDDAERKHLPGPL